MPVADHHAQALKPVHCAVLTVSDSRVEETDTSGRLMRDLLTSAGHSVGGYAIVPDEPDAIRQTLTRLADEGRVQAVLLNGGTGITRRDSTFEAINGLLEKRLDGFGELFRMLSYHEIGAASMLSRAVAGTYRGMMLFSTPGSTPAVRLAMEKLIVPELSHMAWELTRQSSGAGCAFHHKPGTLPEPKTASRESTSAAAGDRIEVIRPEHFAVFQPAKMGKATLFESPRVLVGLNAFEPGQEHALHAHTGMDKIYHVLQGRGLFLLADREVPMEAGQMLIAPEGVPHGVRNNSGERLVVLAVLAPGPKK